MVPLQRLSAGASRHTEPCAQHGNRAGVDTVGEELWRLTRARRAQHIEQWQPVFVGRYGQGRIGVDVGAGQQGRMIAGGNLRLDLVVEADRPVIGFGGFAAAKSTFIALARARASGRRCFSASAR